MNPCTHGIVAGQVCTFCRPPHRFIAAPRGYACEADAGDARFRLCGEPARVLDQQAARFAPRYLCADCLPSIWRRQLTEQEAQRIVRYAFSEREEASA